MPKMKALKSFRGEVGEGEGDDRRRVRAGREFTTATEGRATDLERGGLAVRVAQKAEPRAASNKMEPPVKNKAADTGPLPLAGGKTGEQSDFASLSRPARAQPPRKSAKPKAKRKSSR